MEKIIEQEAFNKAVLWIMPILVLAISGLALHKIFVKGETAYIQFSIVAALCTSIVQKIPFFIKHKPLLFILPIIAIMLLILAIIFE